MARSQLSSLSNLDMMGSTLLFTRLAMYFLPRKERIQVQRGSRKRRAVLTERS